MDLAVSAGSLTVLQPVTARGDGYAPVARQYEVRLSAAGDLQVLGNTSREPASLVLAEGGHLEDPAAYVRRVNALLIG